MQENARG